MANALNTKERLFVSAYLAHGNATKAAVEAGYSEKSARALGARIAKRPHVAKAIEEARKRITHKYDVRAERIVQEMAIIGYSDIRHYLINGVPAEEYVCAAPGAPPDAMRAVKKVKVKERIIPTGDARKKPIIEREVDVEFWDKGQALRNMAEYLKLFRPETPLPPSLDGHSRLSPEERRARALHLIKSAIGRKKKKAG